MTFDPAPRIPRVPIREKPWVSGPKELLLHALEHLERKTSFNSRIAFISVDNAVEVAVQTFLSLPPRSRGTAGPVRRELDEARGSLPRLLDLLERNAETKLGTIDPDEIRFYHGLRNALYHEGNGITVEPDKVEAYLEIARVLFLNLFDIDVRGDVVPSPTSPVALFLASWADFEERLQRLAHEKALVDAPRLFDLDAKQLEFLLNEGSEEVERLRDLRNQLAHGEDVKDSELRHAIKTLDALAQAPHRAPTRKARRAAKA